MKVYLAEKPSVARELATVLKIDDKQDGCFYSKDKGIAITWAFGHLLQIASPADMGYTTWSKENLPMVPDYFKIIPRQVSKPGGQKEDDKGVLHQLKIIRSLFNEATEIICATDAGREGELIFRYIYTYLNISKPIKRLWISSLTDEAIRKGLNNLKDGEDYYNLYLSAKSRAEADWLVGLNATQTLSIATNKTAGVLSLGRVQTPTLAMICNRYNENKNFESSFYYKLIVALKNSSGEFFAESENFTTLENIHKAVNEAKQLDTAITEEITEKAESIASPLLYDLTYLQQEANILYGYSADSTIKTAQKLYEKKLITYPRTSSRYISHDVFETIPELLNFASTIKSDSFNFPEDLLTHSQNNILNKRAVNDSKISDHHALLPTGHIAFNLNEVEQNIYDLIVSKMLEAFSQPAKVRTYKGQFLLEKLTLKSSYTETLNSGWKSVREQDKEGENEEKKNKNLRFSKKGEFNNIISLDQQKLKTKPKALLTEATLLKAMENCSSSIDDEILSDAIKENGLGTPATRASIIEILFTRNYIERKGKSIIPTNKGLEIYNIVKDMKISQPLLTGEWEHRLSLIEDGSIDSSEFINSIKAFTTEIVTEILDTNFENVNFSNSEELLCPKCQKSKIKFYDKIAKCSDYENCDFKIFREIATVKITKSTIADLITKKKSKKLKGFYSKKKEKKFDAYLILDDDFNINFTF